jgi:hypothetical protein
MSACSSKCRDTPARLSHLRNAAKALAAESAPADEEQRACQLLCQALEFMGILEQGIESERSATIDCLKVWCGTRFIEAARKVYPSASPRLQQALETVLPEFGSTE